MDNAQDAKTAAQDAGSSTGDTKAQDAKVDLEDKIAKLVHDRKQANAEAVALKKQLEEAASKLKGYEDREKTESQKMAEQLAAVKKLAEEQTRAAEEARVRVSLLESGVAKETLDYACYEYQRASAAEGFDRAEWIKDMKKKTPFLFGGQQHGMPTGTAGPPAGGAVSEKQARIDEITREIDRLNKMHSLTFEDRSRLISLVGERAALRR